MGTNAGLVQLWEVAAGQQRLQWSAHRKRGDYAHIPAVAFSANGQLLVTGGWDTDVRLWHAATGKEVGHLRGHQGAVTAVALSGDGKALLSGSADTTLLTWDVSSRTRP